MGSTSSSTTPGSRATGRCSACPTRTWRAVHDVVLYGAFCMSRAAAPLLRGSRDAPPAHHRKIVNVSSNVGLHALGTANYSAAKAGLIGLTKALAREWAKSRVNVNAIAPGFVTGTGLADDKPAELLEHVIAQQPFGRAGTPEDRAAAVAFRLAGRRLHHRPGAGAQRRARDPVLTAGCRRARPKRRRAPVSGGSLTTQAAGGGLAARRCSGRGFACAVAVGKGLNDAQPAAWTRAGRQYCATAVPPVRTT